MSKRFQMAAVGTAAGLFITAPALAAPVLDFFTLKATTATTLSGTGNTANPVLGTVDPDPVATGITAAGSRLIGYFTPQTLTDIGDSITLSFSLTFNDESAYGTGTGDNFRFALYDRSLEASSEATNSDLAVVGTTNTDQFRGYWFGILGGGAGANGSIRERNVIDGSQIDPFTNNSATLLGNPTGTSTPITGAINGSGAAPVYTGAMTLTLTAAGVDLSGSFSGNGGANTFAFLDTTPIATTYGAVGFLNGGGLSADQINFSNVDVTFTPAVPEPASLALLGLGALGFARRRRA